MTNIFRQQYDLERVQCQIHSLPEIYFDYFGNLTDGTFVEVGAFNCYNWSNTFMLVELGWSGLYIEPHPEYFSKCVERYKDHPRIKLLNLAIGSRVEVVKLFLGGSLTTIKEEAVKTYNQIDWSQSSGLDLNKFIECGVEKLDNILDSFGLAPGFEVLIIDVEGAEQDVMEGFTLEKWKPKLVVVEAHEQLPEKSLNWKGAMFDRYFVEENEYRKIHSDNINNIYVLSKYYTVPR